MKCYPGRNKYSIVCGSEVLTAKECQAHAIPASISIVLDIPVAALSCFYQFVGECDRTCMLWWWPVLRIKVDSESMDFDSGSGGKFGYQKYTLVHNLQNLGIYKIYCRYVLYSNVIAISVN